MYYNLLYNIIKYPTPQQINLRLRRMEKGCQWACLSLLNFLVTFSEFKLRLIDNNYYSLVNLCNYAVLFVFVHLYYNEV